MYFSECVFFLAIGEDFDVGEVKKSFDYSPEFDNHIVLISLTSIKCYATCTY